MQDDIHKRTMNAQLPVVFNVTKLTEAIHKEADPGASAPDHLRQSFLAYLGNDGIRHAFFAKLGQQQQCSCKTLLAGVEKLVNQVCLDSRIASQQVGHK